MTRKEVLAHPQKRNLIEVQAQLRVAHPTWRIPLRLRLGPRDWVGATTQMVAAPQDGLRRRWNGYQKAPAAVRHAPVQVGLRGTEAPASRRGAVAGDRGVDRGSRQAVNEKSRSRIMVKCHRARQPLRSGRLPSKCGSDAGR